MARSNTPEPVAIREATSPRGRAARTSAIAGLVAAWWTVGGDIALLGLVALAVLVEPLLAFVVAASCLTIVDTACCTWLDHHWDEWLTRAGDRLARSLERMRSNAVLRRVVVWLTGASPLRFVIAAVVTSPITTVCLVRLGGGAMIGRNRVAGAALANAVVVGMVAALVGHLVDVVRAA